MFVIDDTGLPKCGTHSVGASHQYGWALGKRANCQVAVTLHYSGQRGHFPLAPRLHPPEGWTDDPKRMIAAGVPEAFGTQGTKGQTAQERLDKVRGEGIAGRTVVADAGYGNSGALRDGLAERGLRYVVGVEPETVVLAQQARWELPSRGRRGGLPTRWVLTADSPRPVVFGELAGQLQRRRVSWREGTKGPLSALVAWVRVWPGADGHRGMRVRPEPVWLLVEE